MNIFARRTPRPAPDSVLPDSVAVLSALPVPVVVLDAENRFRSANPAAEQFFQLSMGSLSQITLGDLIPPDTRLFAMVDQVRNQDAPVSDHDLTLESPRLHRTGVAAHGAPLPEMPGAVVLTLQDGSKAQKLDRQLNFRGAARDDVIPLSKPFTSRSGKLVGEIAVPKGTRVILSLAGYNRCARTTAER